MKTCLIFFPHNPWPPRSGAHRRCLEVIAAFQELGWNVTLGSSELSSEYPWTASAVDALEKSYRVRVRVRRRTPSDRWVRAGIHLCYRAARRSIPLNSRWYGPPAMRRWFARIMQDVSPDIVLMNYVYWDGLISHDPSTPPCKIIETLDLLSLTQAMQRALGHILRLTALPATATPDSIVDEGFFEKLRPSPNREEFHIYDRYHAVISGGKLRFFLRRTLFRVGLRP